MREVELTPQISPYARYDRQISSKRNSLVPAKADTISDVYYYDKHL